MPAPAQAIKALKIGKSENPSGYIFTADSLYTKILLSGAIERLGKQILELSDIRCLAQYDADNRTEYLRTLEQYLIYGNRLSNAAKSMFIDRSTMKYRLSKIMDIIKKDIDRPDVAKQLRTGIAIYRLCGK